MCNNSGMHFDIVYMIAARKLCAHKRVLHTSLKDIIADNGEGVILRMPESMYEGGRSPCLIKIKVFTVRI